jgi:hypothetical protein
MSQGQIVEQNLGLVRVVAASSRARHPIPEQKAPFRMLFPVEILAAFLAKLAAKFPAQPVAKRGRCRLRGLPRQLPGFHQSFWSRLFDQFVCFSSGGFCAF